MAGSRKAAVLPVPVGADARISRPSRAGSSTICWMVVGRVKPISAKARLRAGFRSKSSKDWLMAILGH